MRLKMTAALCLLCLSGGVARAEGRRPCHGDECRWIDDRHWRDYVLFHEYFDGDTGRGLGASHQTGWTALIASLLEDCAKWRADYSCYLPAAREIRNPKSEIRNPK